MDYVFVGLLLLAETLLGFLIIRKVPYTEIDWEAYMQEVDFWMGGEYDYRKIYGGTGPLVYPAGFLYLFGLLQWLTNYEVSRAQPYFLLFYVSTQAIVMAMYTMVESLTRTSHTIWSLRVAMGCLCLSKRFHSIFMLRLFNDAPTMLMAYFSFYCFMNQRWNVGCFLFSLAVSLKMNVLLFAPGLLYLLIQASPYRTIPRLAICAFTQLVLGAPFLLRHPVSYLRKAFELDRQFFHKWTVNFKFLPEDVFLSKSWAILLLVLHLGLLGIYTFRLYRSHRPLTPVNILSTLWVTNFIGMCCARTIHYQFYCWYFPSLPFLLWLETPYPLWLRLCCLGAIEYSYLTFPATPVSSLVLQIAHWAILLPCVFGPLTCCGTDTKSNAALKQQ
eukprot:Nitzschia sp. Nitz4//scaffold157_size52427//32726//33925//NITZ4_006843-RA/size52427-exonerate_protein2genome-gene-0.9-mRNA-1//1//CDS//3329537464//4426//frame0